ncbi:MAG: surface-layer protein, partial [Clostridiaceae bacterium]|nr:surface-layer protein [Clostridiaceae bacterium]
MRNLKKLLAVVLTVVMIASMMVPALAANTYEDEALKLQAINVFAGGPEDLKLDEGVTRIQGLTFAIRAAGKDAEALAMEDAEVDAILADWTDADSIPAWGRKYAAYAIKNSITVGLSATEKIFGAMNPISGTSFLVFIMKAGMGYADVTTATVVEASVNAGILTAGQAAGFGANEALIRDDAAGILFGAFTTGVNAD